MTVNGNGMLNLDAIAKLRYLVKLGYKVIYVTGRSSIEAYILSVFSGTTNVSIGENGGVITTSYLEHTLLANKEKCIKGLDLISKEIDNVQEKPVFPRMTEVVLNRSFDLEEGNRVLKENNMDLILVDSEYAYHINEININKGFGLAFLLKMYNIKREEVVTIGDSETDISMFAQSKYGITFESSSQKVRDSSTHVVRGQNGEGLINAIDLIIQERSSE